MQFFTRQRPRRAFLPALLACLAMAPLLAGCAEDRSNLIPKDVANSLFTKISQVDELAAEGKCFEAKEVAASAQTEIENLGGDIDPELKRSLLDGVTQLQVLVGDQETCTESGIDTEPTETEETPTETEGTTGETGTTDTSPTPTGEQGPTDDEQNEQEQPQGNGNGTNTPINPPAPTPPTPTPNPTNPGGSGSVGPGSGGIGPG